MTDKQKVVSHPSFFSPENLMRLRDKVLITNAPVTAGMLWGYYFVVALLAALLFLAGMGVARGDVNVRALCLMTFGMYAVGMSLIAILLTGERLSGAAALWATLVAFIGMWCFLYPLAFPV